MMIKIFEGLRKDIEENYNKWREENPEYEVTGIEEMRGEVPSILVKYTEEEKAGVSIRVKYFSDDLIRLEKIAVGDWIDLRVDTLLKHNEINIKESNVARDEINTIAYEAGDVLFLGLGVAMELPEGYEAVMAPRSGTYKRTGLIQTNSIGVIDGSYCGDNDEWGVMMYATTSGTINRQDRICQFRIQKNQPRITFIEVPKLEGEDRGGFHSTGVK